jgi:hypothetical protein
MPEKHCRIHPKKQDQHSNSCYKFLFFKGRRRNKSKIEREREDMIIVLLSISSLD